MQFDDRFLDELSARVNIVDVVSKYVRLNRRGGRFVGLCPFHNEKTPSFSVEADKQLYYCFGCGAGGGTINFVMRAENLDFTDAVLHLCDTAGLRPPDSGSVEDRRSRERLLSINKEAARFFHNCLLSSEGATALEYVRKRRISPQSVQSFGLGYSPPGWDALIRAMAEKGYKKEELIEAGLCVKSDHGGYDRFRNRLIFPIIDVRGGVIGFGGRVMDDSQPKYLNSPDTRVFNKSRNLFALNIAKKHGKERIILAEGYMDVIALHMAGFQNAVASLGTALTTEQARLLSRYTAEVVIAYDADNAGTAAASRAIEIFAEAGLPVRVLTIPGAKDPDEFIQKNGPQAFAALLEHSEHHMSYSFAKLKTGFNLEDDDEKVKYLQAAAEKLALMRSPVEREVFASRVAEEAGVKSDAVQLEIKRRLEAIKRAREKKEHREILTAKAVLPKKREVRYKNLRLGRAEEGIIAVLAANPVLFSQINGKIKQESFSSPHLGRIFASLAQRLKENRPIGANVLSAELSQEEMELYCEIMSRPINEGNAVDALSDYISRIELESPGEENPEKDPLQARREKYIEKKGYGGSFT